jgi:hypothetical protein
VEQYDIIKPHSTVYVHVWVGLVYNFYNSPAQKVR